MSDKAGVQVGPAAPAMSPRVINNSDLRSELLHGRGGMRIAPQAGVDDERLLEGLTWARGDPAFNQVIFSCHGCLKTGGLHTSASR